MASERDAQEKREGVSNRPPQTPPPEQLEEESASPAQAEEGGTRTDREASRERASTSMESPPTLTTKSTEGITVGGTEKTPSD